MRRRRIYRTRVRRGRRTRRVRRIRLSRGGYRI